LKWQLDWPSKQATRPAQRYRGEIFCFLSQI